jgi:hypothetical protein
MVKTQTQESAAAILLHDVGVSFRHFASSLVGRRHLTAEVTSAAAHFDGLIDTIERAGWEISRLEQVRHAFDETAQSLLAELVEGSPEMSPREQRSYLAPFQAALHQFSHLSQYERGLLRAEYGRFAQLHAQVIQSYSSEEPV